MHTPLGHPFGGNLPKSGRALEHAVVGLPRSGENSPGGVVKHRQGRRHWRRIPHTHPFEHSCGLSSSPQHCDLSRSPDRGEAAVTAQPLAPVIPFPPAARQPARSATARPLPLVTARRDLGGYGHPPSPRLHRDSRPAAPPLRACGLATVGPGQSLAGTARTGFSRFGGQAGPRLPTLSPHHPQNNASRLLGCV